VALSHGAQLQRFAAMCSTLFDAGDLRDEKLVERGALS
jgi:hypothetical protein